MSARPLYLDAGGAAVFGMVHVPSVEVARGSGVLLVPPFGWDDVVSYRCRRTWANQLAQAGHLTLRIDLPGAGGSGGRPSDPDRLGAWTAAVTAGATWLRETAGSGGVALAGIGLGGLLTVRAVAAGAPADDLILWAVPSRGRRLVREIVAFARMEDDQLGELRAAERLEAGAIESGGYLLTAETAAALHAVDLTAVDVSGVPGRRALVLGRDESEPDERLVAHLRSAGIETRVASGVGYSAMHALPHTSKPAQAVITSVAAFLAERPAGTAAPIARRDAIADLGGGVCEQGLALDVGGVRLFGVVSENTGTAAGVTAVLLNAGAIRRSGPNRMWTEAARRWTAAGVSALRLDLEGIGDAHGEDVHDADVSLYVPHYVAQVRAALDMLEGRGFPPRFVLCGLCSGAYWALHTALEDPRVCAAALLNPRLLVFDEQVIAQRQARDVFEGARESPLRRLLRGHWTPRQVVALFLRFVRAALVRSRAAVSAGVEVEPVLERIEERDARFLLAFSGSEPLYDELEVDGTLARLGSLGNVEIITLPGHDHTLRPLAAQRAAHAALDELIDAEVRRADG